MTAAHARLAPSSAHRWLTCTGSIALIEALPEHLQRNQSRYAQEGTIAHELAAAMVTREFVKGKSSTPTIADWDAEYANHESADEMRTHAAGYVEAIRTLVRPGDIVMVERRVDTGIPECWGTCDTIVLSESSITIVDYKYGMGVGVTAEDNPQLMLYALGALREYGDLIGDTETVVMAVYQPRRRSDLDTWSMSAENLREWGERIKPRAEAARTGVGTDLVPTAETCRFCPALATCPAAYEENLTLAQRDFDKAPAEVSPTDLAQVLRQADRIRQWLDAVERYALDLAYHQGRPVPGFKAVLSGGRRRFSDPTGAIQHLIELGFKAEDVARFSPLPIGKLTALLGKPEDFDRELGRYVIKTPPSPSLVAESDPRAPVTSAAIDFGGDD